MDLLEIIDGLNLRQIQRRISSKTSEDPYFNASKEFNELIEQAIVSHKEDLLSHLEKDSPDYVLFSKILHRARFGFVVGDKIARTWDDRHGTITRISDAYYFIGESTKIKKDESITVEEKLLRERRRLQAELLKIEEMYK